MNLSYRVPRLTGLCAALSLLLSLPAVADSVQYAGSLQDGGKPANGVFDLRVQLYSAEQGGVAMSEPMTFYAVTVQDGRFSVPVELSQPLPAQGSVWLEAQLKAPDGVDFQALQGRQEVKSALGGGTCWDTNGNTGLTAGVLGANDAGVSLIALRNSTTNLYLRRNGGIEQGSSAATAPSSVAFGDFAAAGAVNSFAAGRASIGTAHTFTTVFSDGQSGAMSSTAANQFLIRAQNGVAINTNTPLGTLTVRRGGSSGVAVASASSITAESDSNNYLSLLSPGISTERGILFGDSISSANGAIIFNPVAAGITNPDGLTFRTGGNVDRLKITDTGQLILNQQSASGADVTLRSASGGNNDFSMTVHSNNGSQAVLRVAEDGADVSLQATSGNLRLLTSASGKYIITNDRLGVSRSPAVNMLEVEGNASKTTATAWLANSDRRIKQDIQPIDDALRTLRQVQPVSFEYTESYRAAHPSITTQRYYNVIAQDFAKVFPDAVQRSGEHLPGAPKTSDTEILQVDTYPATITAIAAIQELDVANAVQDDMLAALKHENAQLRQRLDALEQLIRVQR
ncbi:tail fiber domain-containing protein [Aquimonas sp.]|jgi:hypothetical protein|uniref:tail fiber domain-containing protein n=1 Tax=Aquimonas sp. TaxID=1872588 RepID=UPI0037BE6839